MQKKFTIQKVLSRKRQELLSEKNVWIFFLLSEEIEAMDWEFGQISMEIFWSKQTMRDKKE